MLNVKLVLHIVTGRVSKVTVRAADVPPFLPAHRRSQDQDTTGTVILLVNTTALVSG